MTKPSLETRRSITDGRLRAESEKQKTWTEIERLVTFVRVGVGKWSCDLDAPIIVVCMHSLYATYRRVLAPKIMSGHPDSPLICALARARESAVKTRNYNSVATPNKLTVQLL